MLLNGLGLLPPWCKMLSICVYIYKTITTTMKLVEISTKIVKRKGGLIMKKIRLSLHKIVINDIFNRMWNLGVVVI